MKYILSNAVHSTLFLSFLLVWITSCSVSKTAGDSNSQNKSQENISQIIFLNYSIQRDSIEGYKIELINKIVSNGTLKIKTDQNPTPKIGDLRCWALNEVKHPISDIHIPDPLIKRVEYQQDNGSLATKEVTLDSTEFSVRMQLDKQTKYIAIESINSSNGSYLILTEIN